MLSMLTSSMHSYEDDHVALKLLVRIELPAFIDHKLTSASGCIRMVGPMPLVKDAEKSNSSEGSLTLQMRSY